MVKFILSFLLASCITVLSAPPNRVSKTNHAEGGDAAKEPKQVYSSLSEKESLLFRYLQDVVSFLEKDPKFTASISRLSQNEIREAKFVDIVEEIEPHLREQLKMIKNVELERLRKEITEQIERDGGAQNVKLPEHLDIKDENFTKDDLRKLIKVTLGEIENVEEKRKEAFKEYELEKQAKKDAKLAAMTPEEREKFVRKLEEEKEIRKRESIKHPGGREHLEDVWEEEDHLQKEDFNPRTFFALHDTNSDGFLDTEELIALFEVELSKVYNNSDISYDPVEKQENVHRMLEHVRTQMDKNQDSLISMEEFLADQEVQGNVEGKDWEDVRDEKVFSDEELQNFEREYANKHPSTDLNYSTLPPSATVGQ